MKQANQYSAYIRLVRGTEPFQVGIEAGNVEEARKELAKWVNEQLKQHPYLYVVGKVRRGYKTSNASSYHPAQSHLTIINKK